MIKAVIFDFGNVICAFDNWKFIQAISAFAKRSPTELYQLVYVDSDLPKLYETGFIDSEEFIYKVTDLCELDIKKEIFIKAYTEIFTPIQSTFDVVKKLKPYYKLGFLSNTSDLHFRKDIQSLEIFPLFDAVSLSYEVKAMKPDQEIFFDMLRKLKLDAGDCVYIDDIQEYVDVATTLGMHGILFTSAENLEQSLRQAGVSGRLERVGD